jgi:hypothetical protein
MALLLSRLTKSFRPGDRVIFSLRRHGARPAVGARDVRPEPNGEAYWYVVDKLWVVTETRGDYVVVQTDRGRIHILDAADSRLRRAPWWQRLIFRHRFPKPQPIAPQRGLPA